MLPETRTACLVRQAVEVEDGRTTVIAGRRPEPRLLPRGPELVGSAERKIDIANNVACRVARDGTPAQEFVPRRLLHARRRSTATRPLPRTCTIPKTYSYYHYR